MVVGVSKKMFSWIKVVVWNGERRFESFWWDWESGRRSFTSTSIWVGILVKWGGFDLINFVVGNNLFHICLELQVAESESNHDDRVSFSPQPQTLADKI